MKRCLLILAATAGIGKLGGSARRIGVRDANGHIVNVLLAQLFRDGGKRESCGRTPKPRDVYTHLCAARGFGMQTAISTKYCLLILAATAGIGKLGGSARRIGVRDANSHIVNVLLAQLFRDGGKRESRAGARRIGVRDANGHIVNGRLVQLRRDSGKRESRAGARSPMPANSLFDETRR